MLVILDWDGTLADSRQTIVDAMQAAANDLGEQVPAEGAVAALIGLGLPETVETLFPGLSGERRAVIQQAYSRNFIARNSKPGSTKFFPGVIETLDELAARGHALAVATGKSRKGLNRVLGNEGLEHRFLATRAADETRSKPHPLMLEELLEETGFAVGDAVMVGDTSYDMEMACAIDMPRIAVSYGVHKAEALREYDPLAIIDSIARLLQQSRLG